MPAFEPVWAPLSRRSSIRVLIASDAVFEEIPEGPGALESLESAGFVWFRVTGTIVKMGIGLFRRFQPFGLFLVRSSRWGVKSDARFLVLVVFLFLFWFLFLKQF